MNGPRYVKLLLYKPKMHRHIYRSERLLDDALCHRSKVVTDFLENLRQGPGMAR